MRLNPKFKSHDGEVLFEKTNLLQESEVFMQDFKGQCDRLYRSRPPIQPKSFA